MNKHLKFIASSLLVLGGLAGSPIASAHDHDFIYKFQCPWNLENVGTYISGIGALAVDKKVAQKVQFTGPVPAGTPVNLSSYSNSYVKYDANNGKISCQYLSNIGSPTIMASYTSIALNGVVIKETNSEIAVRVHISLE